MPQKVNFLDKVLSRIGRLDRESIQGYVSGLVRTKQELEQVFDLVHEGLLLLDARGTVKLANRRAFLWLGFQRYAPNRSRVEELVEEQLVKHFLHERLEKPKEMASEEFEVLTPREMVLRIHWVPLEAVDDNLFLVRIENVTPEKAEQDEAAASHRIEGLTRLAAGVAHEIGNPLNSLQIHIGLLQNEMEKLPKPKQASFRKLVGVLSAETQRLDQIVRSFLRASRRPPLRFRKESINQVLDEAVNFLRLEMKKQKVQAKLDLDPKIPDFLLDRDRLHQSFINLVKNALEAMTRGGRLRISTRLKEKLCLIRFEDAGEGIADAHLPHIFEPYYTTKAEGSGLGLSQVYQTVREHGGRIEVKSEQRKGTVFSLALPLRQEPLSLPEPNGNRSEQTREKTT